MKANSPATLWLEAPNTCAWPPGFSVVKPANIPSQDALGGHFASWVLCYQTCQHSLPACTWGTLCLLGTLLSNRPTFPPQQALGDHHPNALTLLYMDSALSRCHTFAYAVPLLEESKPFRLSPPPVRSISLQFKLLPLPPQYPTMPGDVASFVLST